MSLDLVEFVMDLEEHFDVRLPERDFADITTPGQLIDYLAKWLDANRPEEPCPTQITFYAVRQACVNHLGLSRGAIRPSSLLAALIPRSDRRSAWSRLQAALSAQDWPQLKRPVWLTCALVDVSFIVGLAIYQVLEARPGTLLPIILASSAFGFCLWCLFRVATPFATEFDAAMTTMGDLTIHVLSSQRPLLGEAAPRLTREELAAAIRNLVRQRLHVADDVYREDATWGEMGID